MDWIRLLRDVTLDERGARDREQAIRRGVVAPPGRVELPTFGLGMLCAGSYPRLFNDIAACECL